jgi:hypothetical protein
VNAAVATLAALPDFLGTVYVAPISTNALQTMVETRVPVKLRPDTAQMFEEVTLAPVRVRLVLMVVSPVLIFATITTNAVVVRSAIQAWYVQILLVLTSVVFARLVSQERAGPLAPMSMNVNRTMSARVWPLALTRLVHLLVVVIQVFMATAWLAPRALQARIERQCNRHLCATSALSEL